MRINIGNKDFSILTILKFVSLIILFITGLFLISTGFVGLIDVKDAVTDIGGYSYSFNGTYTFDNPSYTSLIEYDHSLILIGWFRDFCFFSITWGVIMWIVTYLLWHRWTT